MTEAVNPSATRLATGTLLRAPHVLVVITSRNYRRFVGEAIRSVAAQSYRNFHCVIVDDCSGDESPDAIRELLAELGDPRFSLVALDRNIGQLAAFRVGMEGRPSHLVAFLDADDVWFPDFLLSHVRAHLNDVCAAPLSSSDAWLVDGEGTALEATFLALGKTRSDIVDPGGIDLPDDACPAIVGDRVVTDERPPMALRYIPRENSNWSWVNTSSMVFRRDFADLAIPPDGEPAKRHADYLLAYTAQFLGGSLIIPQAHGAYRVHGGNLFATLPRIGSFQRVGVEPDGAIAYTHQRMVLHVLRNWDRFADIATPQVLGNGLRRFMRWDRIEAFGREHGIDARVRDVASQAMRKARLAGKRPAQRPLAWIGDLPLRTRRSVRAILKRRRGGVVESRATPPSGDVFAWGQVLAASPLVVQVWPTGNVDAGLASLSPLLADRDATVLVSPSWSHEIDKHHAWQVKSLRDYRNARPRHRIHFVGNTEAEVRLMAAAGFPAVLHNQNCLMDETAFRPIAGVEPRFDAISVARLSPLKRPELAREIERLALIYFYNKGEGSVAEFAAEHARLSAAMPQATFVNKLTPEGSEYLSPAGVNAWLAQARVGLCLSAAEGAMRASIEYLFAGLSVVSTPSLGGRDRYFDDDYCIIADPDPRSIREAVAALVARNVPREHVRRKTLEKVEADRARYVDFVQGLIEAAGSTERFEPRFRTMLHGEGIQVWRSLENFEAAVRAASTPAVP